MGPFDPPPGAPITPCEWLCLSLLPGLGPVRLKALRERALPWPEGWLAVMPEKPRRLLGAWLEQPNAGALGQTMGPALDWLHAAPDRHLLTPDQPGWPSLLDELSDPPALLWGWGDPRALAPPALAVVGTRKPTREGQANGYRFAREMVAAGYGVTSGMALGVDGAAHRGALDGGGRSVAVLGCGVEVLYPRQHAALRQALLDQGGLLLSEHLPGTQARAPFFPRRNRIVTGLSLGVLVVEAAMASGSLVSARLALEQNREVFALPGSLNNPQSRGCHWLIREGAHLITSIEELIEALPPALVPHGACAETRPEAQAGAPRERADTPEDPLWALLESEPIAADRLVERSGVGIGELGSRLMMLELDGWAAQVAGGWVRRLP